MALSISQQEFLEKFLDVRARSKGPLGGRDLSKIKSQYEKFAKQQTKVKSLVSQLALLPGGQEIANFYNESLALLTKKVNAAADIGDETIFTSATKEMEAIRKECKKALESREKEIKSVAKDIGKFDKAYNKAVQEKSDKKQQEALGKLKGQIDEWLGKHHSPPDTAQAWEVRQLVVDEMGGPAKGDLAQAAKELESQAWELGKEVKDLDDTGLDWITLNTSHSMDTKVHQLLKTIDDHIRVAEAAGEGFYVKQLTRVKQSVDRLLWIVDPPPVPTEAAPSLPKADQKEKGGSDEDAVVDAPAKKQETAFQKAGGLIERFEREFDRVKKNLQKFTSDVTALKQKTNSAQGQLDGDYRLLDLALGDAQKLFDAVKKPLADVRASQQEVVKFTGDKWQAFLRKVAGDCDNGLQQLAACEKATGQIEGGLLYIERSFQSIDALDSRLRGVDEELLDKLLDKIPLLNACDGKASGEELSLLKQLTFVSALEPQGVTKIFGKIKDPKSFDKAVTQLIEQPKLSSADMALLLSQCHQIMVDTDRFYGDWSKYMTTLDSPLKDKLKKIADAAKQDVARYTIPFVPRPIRDKGEGALQSVGVAIVGGGPIGLMAAVEARMSGASEVLVFEGRNDPYSRLNVLKVTDPQMQRFRSAGVFDAIFPDPEHAGVASVLTIENALEARCKMLGIKLERGLFLKDVRRNEDRQVELIFKGKEDEPKTCDLLIVATGASVASAQKHADNVVLSDQLGIPFQKSEVKDYAAVGVFSKDASKPEDVMSNTDGWSYGFETNEVKYIVTQLSEEEFNAYCKDPRALRERVSEDADKRGLVAQPDKESKRESPASKTNTIERDGLDDAIDTAWTQLLKELGGNQFYGSDVSDDEQRIEKAKRRTKMSLERTLDQKKKKSEEEKVSPAEVENSVLTFLNMELGIGRFPMEFQQAQQFATDDLSGVLVGDSAATPHPSTAKGLNTGVDEMGSVRDLVEDLEMGGGTEENRKKAMQAYEWETKRRTDEMVLAAMNALQDGATNRCLELGSKIAKLLPDDNLSQSKIRIKIRNHINETMAVEKNSDEARNDRDWKKREGAVKKIRAFEVPLKTAKEDVAKLVVADDTVGIDTLLAPFNRLFP